MITMAKLSKLDKINQNIFRVIAVVSPKDTKLTGIPEMTPLFPNVKIFLEYKNGEISKKKFLKKYRKYLASNNSDVENCIFSIGLSLKEKNSLCFVCYDDDYEIGYLQELVDYICKVFSTESVPFKEARDTIKQSMDVLDFSKKEKKLLNNDDPTDKLSEKNAKKRIKLSKIISKELRSTFGYDGEEYLKELDKKYAVDQVAIKLVSMGIAKFSDNGEFKNIDTSKLKKTGSIVQAILTTYDSDDDLKNVIKEVAKSHDIKIKEKVLKKLDSDSIVGLLGEIYTKLTIYRSEFMTND